VGGTTGFRVVTPDGVRVGRVVGETARGYVIACGASVRRSYRVLPRTHGWVDDGKRTVLLTVPRARLTGSPAATGRGLAEERALAAYWADGA
jgi:hypothetical protein